MDAENNQLIESDEEVYEVEELVGHRHPLNSKVKKDLLRSYKEKKGIDILAETH